MTIRWNINRERQVKGMDVLKTIEVEALNKYLLIDIVDSVSELGINNKRLFVGSDYLKNNSVTDGMMKEMKECA